MCAWVYGCMCVCLYVYVYACACMANHQNFVKLNHLASISCQLFDAKHITGLYPILLAAGFHYRKHLRFLCFFTPFGPQLGVLANATSDSAPECTDVLH